VTDNILQKGAKSGNHRVAIAIGEEGLQHPSQLISVKGNRFTNESTYETAFVWNVTATRAILKGNIFVGPIVALKGEGYSP